MGYAPFYGPDVWRPAYGQDGYEVSDLGNVRSVDRTITMRNGVCRTIKGKRLSPGVGSGPQDRAHVSLGRGVSKNIHTLVAEAFIGPRPDGFDVCHNNGDRFDNRPGNLRYDSHSNNQKDMVRHGTCHTSNRLRCLRGHLLKSPNLVASKKKNGRRECLSCARTRAYIAYHDLPATMKQTVSDKYYDSIMKGTEWLTTK